MYGQQPGRRTVSFGMGGSAPPPRDLIFILGSLFVTYALHFFDSTSFIPRLLQLSSAVWHSGFLWQLATFPFTASFASPLWFLFSLLILFWFGRDVFRYLGRRQFWLLLGWAVVVTAGVAIVVELCLSWIAPRDLRATFSLIQGQNILLTIFIAAFATLYGNATIYLMFVLPLKARWFLWLEILFAFMGFLTTKDFAGFVGICAAVGFTYFSLSAGGPRRQLRDLKLRFERFVLQQRLARLKKKRGFRVVKDEGGDARKGPWIH